jgi:hypothetical protein
MMHHFHFPSRPILAILPTADRFPPLPNYALELLAEFTNPPLRLRDLR